MKGFEEGVNQVIYPWFIKNNLQLKNSDHSKVIEKIKEAIRKELRTFNPNDIIAKETPRGKANGNKKGANHN